MKMGGVQPLEHKEGIAQILSLVVTSHRVRGQHLTVGVTVLANGQNTLNTDTGRGRRNGDVLRKIASHLQGLEKSLH